MFIDSQNDSLSVKVTKKLLNDSFLTQHRKTNSPLLFDKTSALKRSVMMLLGSDGQELGF